MRTGMPLCVLRREIEEGRVPQNTTIDCSVGLSGEAVPMKPQTWLLTNMQLRVCLPLQCQTMPSYRT